MGMFDWLLGSKPTQESCNAAAKEQKDMLDNPTQRDYLRMQNAGKDEMSRELLNDDRKERYDELGKQLQQCREEGINPQMAAGGKGQSAEQETGRG